MCKMRLTNFNGSVIIFIRTVCGGLKMNDPAFQNALKITPEASRSREGIGTLKEKSVHAVLKNYFEPNKENQEVPIGGFIADIAGENGIIEVQTGNFARLNKKLGRFLEYCNVTIVFPVEQNRYIMWVSLQTGKDISRRKSPRRGTVYDVMPQLYRIREYLDDPNLRVCVCLMDTEEIRLVDEKLKYPKKSACKYDKIPISLNGEIYFNAPADYFSLIPDKLPQDFTSADFAAAAGIRRNIAQVTLNLLEKLGAVVHSGKKGRCYLYRKNV